MLHTYHNCNLTSRHHAYKSCSCDKYVTWKYGNKVMKERPIICNTEMVRAILDGRKTQTRRVVKPQPKIPDNCKARFDLAMKSRFFVLSLQKDIWWKNSGISICCPYQVGQKLWVRETYCIDCGDPQPYYKANEEHPEIFPKWKPSIFMPRWASRITLEITDVRVEKLQEISEKDYFAEGLLMPPIEETIDGGGKRFIDIDGWWKIDFKNLWNSIHKKKHTWQDNPWVWVISFRRKK